MAGWAGPAADGDPVRGAAQGEADGTRLEFVLTIEVDDLPAMLADPATPGRLSGTVVAPVLSPRRLAGRGGLVPAGPGGPTHVDTWHMRYEMRLVGRRRAAIPFDGHKVLHDRFGVDLWSDTTTLYVTIRDDAGEPSSAG